MRRSPWRLTVLVDNSGNGAFHGQHGLSIWIEGARRRILFDTGADGLFARHARRLKVPLGKADALVLSHGHGDHTGGLAEALRLCPRAPVYLHPKALKSRSSIRPEGRCSIGLSAQDRKALLQDRRRIRWTPQAVRLFPGAFLTGAEPRALGGEPGGPFFEGVRGRVRDRLEDEQALVLEGSGGNLLVVGCGHPGLPNLLRQAVAVGGGKPIRAVVGGLHLGRAKPPILRSALKALRRHGVTRLYPGHCTGKDAVDWFQGHFPGEVIPLHAGMRFHPDLQGVAS